MKKMKKSILILGVAAVIFASCGEKKKDEVKKEVETIKEEVKSSSNNVELGEKLFATKTCTTCHQADVKIIGPSIKDINKIYAEKNGNIVNFLKGESEAIVDTDPVQVAIMKANLEGFVKDLSDEELNALAAYMKSIK